MLQNNLEIFQKKNRIYFNILHCMGITILPFNKRNFYYAKRQIELFYAIILLLNID